MPKNNLNSIRDRDQAVSIEGDKPTTKASFLHVLSHLLHSTVTKKKHFNNLGHIKFYKSQELLRTTSVKFSNLPLKFVKLSFSKGFK